MSEVQTISGELNEQQRLLLAVRRARESRQNAPPVTGVEIERAKLLERLKKAVESGATIDFGRARNISARVVHDLIFAYNIYQRQQLNYKAPQIALAILEAALGNEDNYRLLRSRIATEGALIEPHASSDFEARLNDPSHWVVSIASAVHPDPLHTTSAPVQAADCQCRLPDDDEHAASVIELPDPNRPVRPDVVYNLELFEKLRESHPATVGYIDQICVDPVFAHLGVAAEARYEALRHIKWDVNRRYPIEHMVGWAFCIQGIELGSDQELITHDFNSLPSMANLRSLLINEQSTRCPAIVLGRMRDKKVPVSIEHAGKKMSVNLLLDWYYLVHELDAVQYVNSQ